MPVSGPQYQAWKHAAIIDVVPGRGGEVQSGSARGRALSQPKSRCSATPKRRCGRLTITGAEAQSAGTTVSAAGSCRRRSSSHAGSVRASRRPVGRGAVIPLPRSWRLTSAMLVGNAIGLLAGWRAACWCMPDPGVRIDHRNGSRDSSAIGLAGHPVLGRRWVTVAAGAFILAVGGAGLVYCWLRSRWRPVADNDYRSARNRAVCARFRHRRTLAAVHSRWPASRTGYGQAQRRSRRRPWCRLRPASVLGSEPAAIASALRLITVPGRYTAT